MKTGIDAFAINIGSSGVWVYLSQILKHIRPFETRYELFGWEFDRFAFTEFGDKFDFIPQGKISGKTANALWHLFKFPDFARRRSYNACFFPAAHRRLPKEFPCFSVGTVHDLAAYWGTRKTREHLGAILRVLLPNSLRRLDRVIVASNWLKEELIKIVNVSESRIEVIPGGVDGSVFFPRPKKADERILVKPFAFKLPYILYAARLHHPVKNHVNLIKAFGIFKQKTKYPHRLVLAGSDDNGSEKIKLFASRSNYRHEILFTGNYPSKSLPTIYAASDFVVIPALYEGFGQSAIEAMASGVPCACARAAALPETAGNAALYFNPEDPEDMADRMVTLATDTALQQRLVAAGLERAKSFSWADCAKKTINIMEESFL